VAPWYIFPCFGILNKENLATLFPRSSYSGRLILITNRDKKKFFNGSARSNQMHVCLVDFGLHHLPQKVEINCAEIWRRARQKRKIVLLFRLRI
jgi:hypothetical protein